MTTIAPRLRLPLIALLTLGAAVLWLAAARPVASASGDARPAHGLRGTGIGDPVGTRPASTCFGAAARDPERRCRDPKLRLTVVPTPDQALLEPNSACTPFERTKVLLPCAFGAAKEDAEAVIALVGDSHAAHWRAALDVAAAGRTWRGVSLTHSGCPFSKAVAKLDDPAELKECKAWNKEALAWFTDHPEVNTVFVSQHTGGKVVVPAGSTTEKTQIAGYRAVWKALPKTVTRIFVIRDTPRNTGRTAACVVRAMKARKPAGPACAVPYRTAQDADPSVTAAQQSRGRVKVIDLTSFMCSKRLCLPVIGGALVHKDNDHLTQTFSATLGPYLLRAINRIGVPEPPAAEDEAAPAA